MSTAGHPTHPTAAADDPFLRANATHAANFDNHDLAVEPARKVAVVICMDARVDPYAALGLDNGDAHLIRNAGGVITPDVIRSLCLSQRVLGTREIVLVHHTRCGVQGLVGDGATDFIRALADDVGATPSWSLQGFADAEDDIRMAARTLRDDPFVPHTDVIRGYVYDVDDGRLVPVDLDA